jgi:hypothetical protein
MPPKKGLSKDDKILGMQALMMESNDIWTLKDLERECPKRKGIIAQSVKDILQELCDNDLVSSDKIGSGKFFWCFPADAFNRRAVARASLEQSIAEMAAEIQALEREVARLRQGREDCAEREALDTDVTRLKSELHEIAAQASKYETMNPVAVRQAQRQTTIGLAAANRWTDNIFAIKSWCRKNYNMDSAAFDRQFEIDETFDYFS